MRPYRMAEFWGYPDCNGHAQWRVHDTTWYKRSNYREVWNKTSVCCWVEWRWWKVIGILRPGIWRCVMCYPHLHSRETGQLMSLDNHVMAGYIRMVFLATTSASFKTNLTPTRKEPPEAVQDTCVHCPCSWARCMEGRLGQRGTLVTSPCQWRYVVVLL